MGYMDQLIDEVLSGDVLGSPPSRGRRGSRAPVQAQIVRELTQADIQRLWDQPDGALSSEPRPALRLRSSHHYAARLMAQGVKPAEIHLATGYAPSTLSNLKQDPAFCELVTYYESQIKEIFLNVHEKLASMSADVLETLQGRLNSDEDQFSNRELLDMLELSLDRTGHGPTSTVKHSVGILDASQIEELKASVAKAQIGRVKLLPATEAPSRSRALGDSQPVLDLTVAESQAPGNESEGPRLSAKVRPLFEEGPPK